MLSNILQNAQNYESKLLQFKKMVIDIKLYLKNKIIKMGNQ